MKIFPNLFHSPLVCNSQDIDGNLTDETDSMPSSSLPSYLLLKDNGAI